MSLHNVTPGAKAPDEFHVIIEIPMNADPIKYEVDEDSGALFVDRFMGTAVHYPCNYGFQLFVAVGSIFGSMATPLRGG